MIAKYLISASYSTRACSRTKKMDLAKMLKTMKDDIALKEKNVDLEIDSRVIGLSNAEKRKTMDLFR